LGATNSTFADGSPPDFVSDDANGLNLEQKNLIESSGQVFSAADREQQAKAVSNLSVLGNFYTDSGAADAYVLNPSGAIKNPTILTSGMHIRFRPAHTNTGASTVNVAGLGLKNLKDLSGNALIAGVLKQDDYCEIVYDSVAGYFKLLVTQSTIIQNYTVVGNIGDTGQFMAGHVLSSDEETLIGQMIAIYNLGSNADISGNSNTLNDADAYNAAAGILNVATSAHLGVAGQHLQADAVAGFSGTGDKNVSIAGWHKPLASGGLLAVGTNSALQKVQYYTDANGFVVFDIAEITETIQIYVVGAWHHIALVYDQANSVGYGYIDGICRCVISATSNLALQASPSIWINSKADGTLEVASYHDECLIYEGVLDQRDIDLLIAATIPEPGVLSGKEYDIIEKIQPEGDTSFEYQSNCQVITKYNAKIFLQNHQYGSTDKVKLTGVQL
jgi:hypothetical protein